MIIQHNFISEILGRIEANFTIYYWYDENAYLIYTLSI